MLFNRILSLDSQLYSVEKCINIAKKIQKMLERAFWPILPYFLQHHSYFVKFLWFHCINCMSCTLVQYFTRFQLARPRRAVPQRQLVFLLSLSQRSTTTTVANLSIHSACCCKPVTLTHTGKCTSVYRVAQISKPHSSVSDFAKC